MQIGIKNYPVSKDRNHVNSLINALIRFSENFYFHLLTESHKNEVITIFKDNCLWRPVDYKEEDLNSLGILDKDSVGLTYKKYTFGSVSDKNKRTNFFNFLKALTRLLSDLKSKYFSPEKRIVEHNSIAKGFTSTEIPKNVKLIIITNAANIAITPNNLLGIDLNIA